MRLCAVLDWQLLSSRFVELTIPAGKEVLPPLDVCSGAGRECDVVVELFCRYAQVN